MKSLWILFAVLPISGCITKEVIKEVERPVPVYVTVHPDRPSAPNLNELEWVYLPEQDILGLNPDNFDKYRENLIAVENYIKELQQGWVYYKTVTSPPNE